MERPAGAELRSSPKANRTKGSSENLLATRYSQLNIYFTLLITRIKRLKEKIIVLKDEMHKLF